VVFNAVCVVSESGQSPQQASFAKRNLFRVQFWKKIFCAESGLPIQLEFFQFKNCAH
jgi:hypothetical protein